MVHPSFFLILLIPALCTCQTHVERLVTEEMYKSDPKFNFTGNPVPKGYHAHFVIFMKKPNFTPLPDDYTGLPTGPQDFSLNTPFFCSGTILTPRYTLTKATPIAYYPLGSYWMVSQHEIDMDLDLMNLIDIDFVLIHPDTPTIDMALVRTTRNLHFGYETRNVNLGIGAASTAPDWCKLVVWSWFVEAEKFNKIQRAEMPFNIINESCSGHSDFSYKLFICLSQETFKYQPCAVNSGAPILCDSVLVGIYMGGACNGNASQTNHALRIDHGTTRDWLLQVLTRPEADVVDEEVTLATCPASQ